MAKVHLWTKSETSEVEHEYQDNVLLKFLRSVALEWSSCAKEFSLTAAELFYNVIYSLDQLKGTIEKDERITYCHQLWDEVYERITEQSSADEQELKNAASLVAVTTGQCLCAIDRLFFFDEIMALFTCSEMRNRGLGQKMLIGLKPIVDENRNKAVKAWLSGYMKGMTFISDEIEDLMRNLRSTTGCLVTSTPNHHTIKNKSSENQNTYPFVINSALASFIITKIQTYLKDKKRTQPKDVMRPVRAAQDAGMIRRITYEEMKLAFPGYCPASRSSVIKYTREDEKPYTDNAFIEMVKDFELLKTNIDKE